MTRTLELQRAIKGIKQNKRDTKEDIKLMLWYFLGDPSPINHAYVVTALNDYQSACYELAKEKAKVGDQ